MEYFVRNKHTHGKRGAVACGEYLYTDRQTDTPYHAVTTLTDPQWINPNGRH